MTSGFLAGFVLGVLGAWLPVPWVILRFVRFRDREWIAANKHPE